MTALAYCRHLTGPFPIQRGPLANMNSVEAICGDLWVLRSFARFVIYGRV